MNASPAERAAAARVNPTTVEIIFSRLGARYGSAWLAKWDGIDPEVVAKDWLHVLERMPLAAVQFALENLPADFPPTAGQFREICRRAPAGDETLRLRDAPKPNPSRLAAEFRRWRELMRGRKPTDWIADLEAKRDAGETLSPFQHECLANAKRNLGAESLEESISAEDRERTVELQRQTQKRVDDYRRTRGLA